MIQKRSYSKPTTTCVRMKIEEQLLTISAATTTLLRAVTLQVAMALRLTHSKLRVLRSCIHGITTRNNQRFFLKITIEDNE